MKLLYNTGMRTRNFRRILGIAILLISLALLIWGCWPSGEVIQSAPISPEEMQLPSLDPGWFYPALVWVSSHVG